MILGKDGRSAPELPAGHKNHFGPGAVFIALHQNKIRIMGQGGQNRLGGKVSGRKVRHLEESRSSQGHRAGAGLPETPGIFAGVIDFQDLVAMLDGGDLKAPFPGQAQEFADQLGFAAVGKTCYRHCLNGRRGSTIFL